MNTNRLKRYKQKDRIQYKPLLADNIIKILYNTAHQHEKVKNKTEYLSYL